MRHVGFAFLALLAFCLLTGTARAEDTVEGRLKRLEAVVQEQARQLAEQQQALTAQQKTSAELKQQLQQKDQEIRGLKSANAPLGQGPVGSLVERPGASAPDTQSMYGSWRDGLSLRTADEKFKLRIGGRIVNDWSSLNEDERISKASGKQEYTTMMRSARITFSGEMPNHVIFAADYEFADDFIEMDTRNTLRSVYIGLTDLPYIGTWRVGRLNEPFSLEDLTDPLFQTFTEPGLPEALIPGARGVISRSLGTMLNNTALDERMTWAVGYFRDALKFAPTRDNHSGVPAYSNIATDRQMTDSFEPGGRANWGVTARVTGLPWYEDDGAKLLHLGAGYSHRSNWDRRVHIFSRPEVRAASLLTSLEMDSGGTDHLNAELALVYNQFSLQAQYVAARVRESNAPSRETVRGLESNSNTSYYVYGDQILDHVPPLNHDAAFFQSFYVYGSVFLTGEHRNYLKRYGAFGRVRPKHDFLDGQGGLGAFELAFRYSYLDLQDGLTLTQKRTLDPMNGQNWSNNFVLPGGKMNAFTAGLNWYLNPNMRTMFNYNFTHVSNGYPFTAEESAVGPDGRPLLNNGNMHSVTLRFQLDF